MKTLSRPGAALLVTSVLWCAIWAGSAAAAPPAEVLNVQFSDSSTLSWDATVTAQDYNVYRGLLRDLQVGNPPRCHADEVVGTSVVSSAVPEVGEVYVYLLSAENATDEEGTLGTDSDAVERESLGKCDAVMFHHVLQRLGYGWSEWGRDRLQTLGFTAYRDEQLDPLTIDESGDSRAQLWTRWDPPVNEGYLQYRLLDESIYSLRQLQHHTTEFWFNHFNTEFRKVYDNTPGAAADRNLRTAQMQQREMDAFRDLAFYGSFREMLEASALSSAMILYLDTNINTKDRPNENHARELMELHSMGVDNGYTEVDVQELSRVLTGWNVCNKALADINNPTAPCIANDAAGQRATNFRSNEHDTGQKVLFAGTAYETIIPDTSGNPADGINDIQLALDTIADHPATKEFIATKLLQRFIVEDPTPQMVQGVVDAWTLHNGDNREILRAVLSEANVLNPDFVGQKLKTPWEQGVTGYRATRGLLQSFIAPFLRNWINRMGQLPFRNPIPTGYSESGGDWLGTNAQLDRQDYGMDVVLNASYAQEINLMVSEYSLSTDEEIVDFFADVLFGGQMTPFERQVVLDYLNTDDSGVPSPYTDERVRETVGFMMGLKQFLEQ